MCFIINQIITFVIKKLVKKETVYFHPLPYFLLIFRYTGALSGLVYIFMLPSLLKIASLRKEKALTNFKLTFYVFIIILGFFNMFSQFFITDYWNDDRSTETSVLEVITSAVSCNIICDRRRFKLNCSFLLLLWQIKEDVSA